MRFRWPEEDKSCETLMVWLVIGETIDHDSLSLMERFNLIIGFGKEV